MIIGKTSDNTLPENIETVNPFKDLGGYEWARESIVNLYKKKIISGITSESFAPGNAVTREEFVKMLVGAAQAETAGGLIRNVWSNTIYKKRDAETDKYTLKKGKFVSDFNTALDNLFADEEFQKSISAIQSNQNEVTELMKQLKNPPKEYAEAYTVLKTYYDNYLTLTKMVISPTGSLNSFTEDFNRADEEAVKSFEKMRLYLN